VKLYYTVILLVTEQIDINNFSITPETDHWLNLFFFSVFMFRWWQRYWLSCAFKFSLFLLFIVLAVGEFGCFWWAFCTWRIPKTSRDSLNLLFVSDSQIQVTFKTLSQLTIWDFEPISFFTCLVDCRLYKAQVTYKKFK